MSFETHIDEVYRKVMGTLIYLNRAKDCLDQETRLIVVQSLALSLLNYCFTVWGAASLVHLKRLQKAQNFAARVVSGNIKKYDHVSPFIKEIGWLKLRNRYKYNVCIVVFKSLRHYVPDWLYCFTTIRSNHGLNTRNGNNLLVRRSNLDLGAREIYNRGPSFWNELPIQVRESNTLNSFKDRLKNYMLSLQV